MKKVIIIFYGEYPNSNSWANRIRNTVKIFNNIEFDYNIVIPYPPLNPNSLSSDDLKVVRLQKVNKITYNLTSDIYFFLKGIIKSYNYIKQQKDLDLVFFAGGSFIVCFPILFLCKRKNIKVWIDIVDENSKKFENKKSFRDRLAIINKDIFDKLAIPKFERVYVISDYLYNKYRRGISAAKLYKSVPSIIDIEEFDLNSERNLLGVSIELNSMLSDRRLKLLYAGSVVRPNGVLFVMDCVAEIINKHKHNILIVIIVLMGDKSIILNYAKRLGISNNLLLIGKQNQQDMPAIYKHSDILFLPEQGSIIANAGFPGKTAELLASGKPVITTKFSDLHLYLKNGENAMISEIGNYEEYINNLLLLIDSEEYRGVIGRGGRRSAIEYFDYKSNVSYKF